MKTKLIAQTLFWLLLLASLTTSCTTVDTGLTGEVVSIADGDTLTLLTPQKEQVKVRLAEIDTPEKGQPYYQVAKQALADRVFREDIRVEVVNTDRYGRTVGKVYLDGEYINAWMVAEGHAWVYRQYSDDPNMLALEANAQEQKLGLWALPEAERIPPWEWRNKK